MSYRIIVLISHLDSDKYFIILITNYPFES